MGNKSNLGLTPRPAFDLPRPNDGLAAKGGLANMTDDAKANGSSWPFENGDHHNWVDVDLLDRAVTSDKATRAACDKALASLGPRPNGTPSAKLWDLKLGKALAEVDAHVTRVYFDVVLVDAVARFERVKRMVSGYALARRAADRARGNKP